MFKPRMLIALIAIIIDCNRFDRIGAFNISPMPNAVIKMPNLPTYLPQTRSSYFGFSIVLRENSILIGAPRAQSTLASQITINETGAIYRCPLNFKRSMEQSPAINCEPYIFESSSNLYYSNNQYNEVRDHQWLGAAMDGGTKDDEPLLVCAPRFDGGERYGETEHDYLHGICYRSENTLASTPAKSDYWKLKPLTKGYQVHNGYYHYQVGQMGFSAHITPDNEENIMGAPGIKNWAGSVVRFSFRNEEFNIPGHFSENDLTLTGYAVASGYLNPENRKELFYVTTSPHENMEFGQAYIYQFWELDVDIYAVFKGTQYGEYYGYAALVCDINGDGVDDVLITAPQYRLDGSIDIGAIYVYVNVGYLEYQRQIIEAPFKKEARFGSTIMNLGDINRDGYNDIAVGAPLANGNGAVVIYLGSKNGLESQPSQFLNVPDSSSGYFGHGLSKGVDIDGNGYNDLAIGAPNNEAVYIYRTYPVLNVAMTIRTKEPSIDLQTESIEYRICYHIDNDMIVGLELDLIADPNLKRIQFNDNKASRLHVQVLAAKFEKCQIFNASITFLSSQVFVPLTTTVIHRLTNDGKRITAGNFCARCAILDPRVSNATVAVIKYKHGCASDICKVDLKIEALSIPEKLIAGSSNLLPIKYAITSKLEKAFDTQVAITNSLNLTLARIPRNCHETDVDQVICDIAKDQLYLQDVEYLHIEYDLSNMPNDKDVLVVTATVTGMGIEQESDDNRVERRIHIKRYSELEILGYPEDNLLILKDEETLLNFKYTCKLQNLGPSTITNVNISFYIPVAFNDVDDSNSAIAAAAVAGSVLKQTVYIDQNKMSLNATVERDEEIPHLAFELSSMGPTEFNSYENVTYNFPFRFRFPFNRTLFQYCNESSAATCAKSTLRISILEAWKSLTLTFAATFKSEAIRDLLQNERFLALFVNVTARKDADGDGDGYLNITQLVSPIVVQYQADPQTPLWIYVASIIGGILLLALLTLSLWKFGFFRRQSQEDMQKLLNEKLQNACAKEETELSDGIPNETFEDIDIDSRA